MDYDYTEVLKDLVRIDTTNPPGNEREALAYIGHILEQEEIEYTILESAPGRGNLLAVLPATQPAGERPLILLSHIDVVMARPEQWKYPPFEAREADGYIYGRGTVDTKQLTVMELAAMIALKRECNERKRDVYLLVTCDEECGSALGLSWFLEQEAELAGRSFTGKELFLKSEVISEGGGFPVLVGDKTFYLCESGQKGCGTVEFVVEARKAKGPFFGSGDGMQRAMGLVAEIGALKLEQKKLATVEQFEKRIKEACGQDEFHLALSPVMNNIVTAMNRNTMTVTLIKGKNVNRVSVICDVRLLPGYGTDYLKEITDGLAKRWDAQCTILSFSEGYESQCEGGLVTSLECATKECLGDEGADAKLLPFISMGSSDGRFLVPLKAKVYGYSPVLSWDMTFDQAVSMVHGVDEKIHKDSVVFGCNVLTKAIFEAVCGSK